MSNSATERIHPASAQRRQLAAREGHVAKSHTLIAAIHLAAGLAMLLWFGGEMAATFRGFATRQFSAAAFAGGVNADAVVSQGRENLWQFGRPLLPLLGGLAAIAIGSHLMQSGFLFLPQRLLPDASRIDPVRNLQRLCSAGHLASLVVMVLKIAIVLAIGGWAIWSERNRLLTIGALPTRELFAAFGPLVLGIVLKVLGAIAVLGIADYAWQRWRLEQALQMTPEELREEARNQNGNPVSIGRRRRLARNGTNRT